MREDISGYPLISSLFFYQILNQKISKKNPVNPQNQSNPGQKKYPLHLLTAKS